MENEKDNRTGEYNQPNDRLTHMTDLEKCVKRLEEKGYTEQFRVEKKILQSLTDKKGNDDQISRLRQFIASADARLFLQEQCMHICIDIARAD